MFLIVAYTKESLIIYGFLKVMNTYQKEHEVQNFIKSDFKFMFYNNSVRNAI